MLLSKVVGFLLILLTSLPGTYTDHNNYELYIIIQRIPKIKNTELKLNIFKNYITNVVEENSNTFAMRAYMARSNYNAYLQEASAGTFS